VADHDGTLHQLRVSHQNGDHPGPVGHVGRCQSELGEARVVGPDELGRSPVEHVDEPAESLGVRRRLEVVDGVEGRSPGVEQLDGGPALRAAGMDIDGEPVHGGHLTVTVGHCGSM
jgi:hypothetical protein